MYFDPVSAWLVALLADGILLFDEKNRGNWASHNYHKESAAFYNRSLNNDIRKIKEKYQLDLFDGALNQIKLHIIGTQKRILEHNGVLILDSDNIQYIVNLLELYINKHKDSRVQKYVDKVNSYQRILDKIKKENLL